jgi:hypothetical protein
MSEGNSEIAGFTAPFNAPGQAESRASKRALDGWVDERSTKPAWYDLYHALMAERDELGKARWDWRKALYIAWASLPVRLREPRTQEELAINFLGLTNDRTIRDWKAKDEEINDRIAEGPKRLLLDRIADIMDVSIQVATDPTPQATPERRMLLEIAGIYKPKEGREISGPEGRPMETRVEIAYEAQDNTGYTA